MLLDKETWKQDFVNDKFVNNVRQYIADYSVVNNLQISFEFSEPFLSPREQQILRDNYVSLTSFYYIDHIYKNSPGEILDIGCGGNFFSYFFNNIIGLDHRLDKLETIKYVSEFEDMFDEFELNKVDNAISVCSLHFISIDRIKHRILNFASIIKPGGYGYIGINLARLLDNTDEISVSNLTHLKSNPTVAMDYVKNEINNLDLNIITVEYVDDIIDEFIDGNIRILFKNERKNDISI